MRCDLPEVIETGFGDGHPPPVKKSEREKSALRSLFSVKKNAATLESRVAALDVGWFPPGVISPN